MNKATLQKLQQFKVIVIAWLIIGFFITVYDHLVLLTHHGARAASYSFGLSLGTNLGVALTGALIGGYFLVFYINVRYQDRPYGHTIAAVFISFILIILFIATIIGIIAGPVLTGAPLLPTMLQMAPRSLKNLLVWSLVVSTTQLLLQVNSKFGQRAFLDIIRGKYNTPKSEKRIFMFLDINSSTTIAEQLGDEAYHNLLKDFFADITTPILDNSGEIYQYVGDEVVIAWNYDNGKENTHCLKCFFDIKLYIQQKKEKYLSRYGLAPSFKAGIHCGQVIAGEVGIIKRDITYSGDVLNTTSRILSKCGELNEEVIASSDLLEELYAVTGYITKPLGVIKLRGKTQEIALNALTPA